MKWISVKDELPPLNEYVLLFAQDLHHPDRCCLCGINPNIFVSIRKAAEWENSYESAHGNGWIPYEENEITHWMPLPEPPNDSK